MAMVDELRGPEGPLLDGIPQRLKRLWSDVLRHD
jgi:hypothetical protein